MSFDSNSVGFAPTSRPGYIPKNENKIPLDVIRERAEARKIVQEEMRYKELQEKKTSGETLTKDEVNELRYLTLVRNAEKLADAFEPKVCYVA